MGESNLTWMHSPKTLYKVTAHDQPFVQSKGFAIIKTNQQLSIPKEGVDLMNVKFMYFRKGVLYRPYWELDTLSHTNIMNSCFYWSHVPEIFLYPACIMGGGGGAVFAVEHACTEP